MGFTLNNCGTCGPSGGTFPVPDDFPILVQPDEPGTAPTDDAAITAPVDETGMTGSMFNPLVWIILGIVIALFLFDS